MFEDRLEAALGSPADLARLGADIHDDLKRAGCRQLLVAAAWADAHSAVADAPSAGEQPDGAAHHPMRVERWVAMGPVGCPLVAETCPASLAVAFQTSIGGARHLIGDALNLRHRLPRTWQRVTAGEVHAWKARQLAQRTSQLNPLAAGEVDRLLAGHLELVAWRRFEKMLDATVLHVDEASYHQRARQAATHRDVWATESSDGHRTLIARADSGDVTIFLALVNRIAEALADDGDEDPIGARRAKAIGIAGYPDRALDLLLAHRGDPDTSQHTPQQPEDRQAAAFDDPGDPGDPSDPTDPSDPSDPSDRSDPTDPWAPDPAPAGWATEQHGHYHQPSHDDPDDHDDPDGDPDGVGGREDTVGECEDPVDQADRDWLHRHLDADRSNQSDASDASDASGASGASDESDEARPDPVDGPVEHPVESPGRRWANSGGLNLPAALAAFAELDPATLKSSLAKARPQVVIHLHLTDEAVATGRGVVRTDHGPITVEQLRRFLGDTGGDITVRPVLDPAAVEAVDSYEIPLVLRRAMAIRTPGSVFPYSPTLTGLDQIGGGHPARTGRTDLDHSLPYRRGGPPGQTGPGKLGPLARSEHRTRTVGDWSVRQPDPGTYVWRTPEGWIAITTNQGTLVLGDSSWTSAIWRAAQPAITTAA